MLEEVAYHCSHSFLIYALEVWPLAVGTKAIFFVDAECEEKEAAVGCQRL